MLPEALEVLADAPPISVLSIAGLDPCGGAGLLADARAMRAFGVHACAVATALTAQNTRAVSHIEPVSIEMLRAQIEVLLEDVDVSAIKIGLLPSVEHAQVLAQVLEGNNLPVIYDTVFAPSGGSAFLDEDAARRAVQVLGSCCELLTPNISEAQILCGFAISSREDAECAARLISQRYRSPQVLVKGGHAASIDPNTCTDWLWNGREIIELRAPRLDVPEVRGTGCMLASAIAAQRARGVAMEEAIRTAKRWLAQKIQSAKAIGAGRRVVVDSES